MTNKTPTENPIMEWHDVQRARPVRTRSWYISVAVFLLLCFIYSIATAAWSFLVLMTAVTIIYWFTHRKDPPLLHMRIWEKGYALNDTFIAWKDCKGYWILEGQDHFELHIETVSPLNSDVVIQTGNIDPYQLNIVLSQFCTHFPNRREAMLDFLVRFLKI